MEVTGNNCSPSASGFDVCWDTTERPNFWITLNEFTIYYKGHLYWEEVISFYIDYRDCRYGQAGGSQDISILINHISGIAYYAPGLGETDCDTSKYTKISDGETLEIWEVNDYSGSRDISCMCPIPDITSIEEDENEHPVITWEYESDPNGTYTFELWRLLTQWNKPLGTWYLIDTLTEEEVYTDAEIYVGNQSWGRAYYRITAKIDDLASSDEGYIEFQGLTKSLVHNPDAVEITEYKLRTNYPNPFNPSTKISFDILEQSPVELTVYDIQGQEVITLVNETLDRGNYSVEFNAGQLPSGTYLYKIVAGEFTDTQKMILVK